MKIVGLRANNQPNSYKGDGRICSCLPAAMGMGGNYVPVVTIDETPFRALLKRRRTEEERARRHKEGDRGATFSKSKEYYISDAVVSDTVTTFISKENLIYEDTGGY